MGIVMRVCIQNRWFVCSASMRRADIAAPLSDGMSRLDANHASVSDPLFLLFLFLILGPLPCAGVGLVGMELPLANLLDYLAMVRGDHIWPTVITLGQVSVSAYKVSRCRASCRH